MPDIAQLPTTEIAKLEIAKLSRLHYLIYLRCFMGRGSLLSFLRFASMSRVSLTGAGGVGSGPMYRRGHRRAWFQVCVVVCLFARLPETLTDIVVKVLEYISNGCKNHALKCLDKLGQTSTSLC